MLVLGDAHADDPDNRQALLAAYERTDESAALQTGDLLYYDLPRPTWFVAGNNEAFDVIDALRAGRQPPDVSNANLLASTAAEVDGIRVGGLSGNYAPTQYEKSRDELSGERRRHFVREDVERAKDLDVDVLVTHEAPHGLLSLGYDPGSEPIDELLAEVDPELCLVGHYHRHTEAEIEGCKVVSLAPAWERSYTLDPETLELASHPLDCG